ncbi:collagenase 3-like [Carcharodon carcharias]|uniref:collagenase 3-like n=1 Tax=Carcharodon carcharias TaxID=13397 RepID=UPI001B7F6ABA|nr:collagenase 3-like [Carcharodon carcharias]
MKSLCFSLSFLFVNIVSSLPVFPQSETNEISQSDLNYAQKYIKQFYTLGDGSEGLLESKDSLSGKIKEVQQFYGLQETGKLNQETMEIMKMPRCGSPDLAQYRLYPGRPRWRKPFVTYRIVNYVPQLSYFEIEDAIWRAVNVWQKAIPMNFVRVHHIEADIMISFEQRVHGDNFPFDGHGGTLAHAFSPGPGIGGNIHFDREENWTVRRYGVNLFHVATHELGHALGLGHSRYRSAVMYPTYKYHQSNMLSLSWDDIRAIQNLYGTMQIYNQKSAESQIPDKCDPSISFDAVTKAHGEILLFKNEYFWHTYQQMADAKFTSIQDVWLSLPSNIDAVCEIPEDDTIYFFKGSKFWTYTHYELGQNSSQPIYLFGLPTYVKQIDAVIYIQQTKKIIFFVGDMYWSYNEKIKTMDYGYPKWISSNWPGINDKIDAVLQNNELFYFFSGPRVYEYDNWRKETVRILNSNIWLGC